jgi:hypothetical protein
MDSEIKPLHPQGTPNCSVHTDKQGPFLDFVTADAAAAAAAAAALLGFQ